MMRGVTLLTSHRTVVIGHGTCYMDHKTWSVNHKGRVAHSMDHGTCAISSHVVSPLIQSARSAPMDPLAWRFARLKSKQAENCKGPCRILGKDEK